MMWRTYTALLVFLIPQVSHADDARSWIGAKVILKDQTSLRIGHQIVGDMGPARIFIVRQTNGDWLWLVSKTRCGWVRADKVVRLEGAIGYFTAQIDTNRDRAGDHLSRGLVWSSLGDEDKALADFDEAIKLGRRDSYAYRLRGISLGRKGNRPEAIAAFNEAIRSDPKDVEAWVSRGVVWGRALELDKALADFSEAIRLNPSHAMSYYYRAMVRGAKEDPRKALADFNEAIRLNPYLSDAYARRAFLFTHSAPGSYRDLRRGFEDARRACELTYWEDSVSLETLADVYAATDQLEEAIRWQSKANRLRANGQQREEGEKRLQTYKDIDQFHKNKQVKTP